MAPGALMHRANEATTPHYHGAQIAALDCHELEAEAEIAARDRPWLSRLAATRAMVATA